MRLFHFSDDPHIARFEPRPVLVPSQRPAGREWLNGPLVWAIEARRQAMYLFPRDCPRILTWRTPATTDDDVAHWWGPGEREVVAWIEWDWLDRLRQGRLHRYEMPPDAFEDLGDAGMWVSREPVTPLNARTLTDLPRELREQRVELRLVERLTPLRELWSSTLHASGIRLRDAQGWT